MSLFFTRFTVEIILIVMVKDYIIILSMNIFKLNLFTNKKVYVTHLIFIQMSFEGVDEITEFRLSLIKAGRTVNNEVFLGTLGCASNHHHRTH
jgi:hypothetical protein